MKSIRQTLETTPHLELIRVSRMNARDLAGNTPGFGGDLATPASRVFIDPSC